ncbi:MAG: Ig-like domain-containing protein [Deferrisomatales bacterium]|nr:Ig-like domain-containing protein [Deferrisomatales bacterium]
MSRKHARGFTIVELLVALGIGSILLALIYQVFISQQRGYSIQEQTVEAQQNARIAADELARLIKNIGHGVNRTTAQPQLLYCGPYELVFNADLEPVPAAAGTPDIASIYAAPAALGTIPNHPGNAETYHLALRPTAGRHFDLVRRVYSGNAQEDGEIAVSLYPFDAGAGGAATELFLYYGDFDGDGEREYLPEVNAATSPRIAAGAALDDVVERVYVQVIAETRTPDRTVLAANAGYRQAPIRTEVTPRNLWSCPSIVPNPLVFSHTLTTGTVANQTTTHDFTVFFKGLPEAGRRVHFSLNRPAGDPDSSEGTSLANPAPPIDFKTSDGDGNVSVEIQWASCDTFVNLLAGGASATYTLTARIGEPPPLTTPLGTCPPDSATVTITVVPGGPAHLVVVDSDAGSVGDTISTCGDAYRLIFQARDACGVPVDLMPGDQLSFRAENVDGGGAPVATIPKVSPATQGRPLASVDRLTGSGPAFPWSVLVTYESPDNWPPGATGRTVDNLAFPVRVTGEASGSFSDSESHSIRLEPRPNTIENLTGNMATAVQDDCPTGPVQDTFEVHDCHGNQVWDMSAVTGGGYFVDVEMEWSGGLPGPQPAGSLPEGRVYPLEGGIPPAPLPSGYASYPIPMQRPLNAGVSPLYGVEYQPPACQLGPGMSLAPSYSLTLRKDGSPLDTAGNAGSVLACADCALAADPPVMSECTDSTTITVFNCNRDGEWVRLTVTGSGTGNGSFHPTDPGQNTIDVQLGPGASPSESLASAVLYLGTARDGDVLTVSAESVERDPRSPTQPLWACPNGVAIPVNTQCRNLEIYSDAGFSRKVGNEPGDENCLSRMSELFFEVEDCQYAGSGGRLRDAVRVHLIADDGTLDWVDVDLEPVAPANPGDPPTLFRSVRGLWIEEGPVSLHDGILTYPSGANVQLLAGYKDPYDPSDNWVANLASPALPPLPLKNHDCEKLVRLQPPLPICFPNAITSGGGGVWRGNFQIHWGDVVIRGNVVLAPTPKFIQQSETGQFDGASYSGAKNTDRFVNVYVGRQKTDSGEEDFSTGNYLRNNNTPISQPDPAHPIDRPFIPGAPGEDIIGKGESFGNYFRNLPSDKINEMLRELDYDVMKSLAKGRGAYWYTLAAGNAYGRTAGTLRNPATGQMASLDAVLGLAVVNGVNQYYDGQYIFIDTYATQDPGPATTGADIDATPTNQLPQFSLSTNYTQGVIYIAGSVDFKGGGVGRSVEAVTPPIYDDVTYYPLIEDPSWVLTRDDFPIRPDPSFEPTTFTLSGININGGIYMDGEAIFGGSPKIYGAITTERGFGGSGTPEIWYNYVLNSTQDNVNLCIECCTLELSPSSKTIFPGDVLTLHALNKTGTMIWRSEDPAVATVSAGGVVTAAQVLGRARIIGVDENNCVARSELSVVDPCSVFGIVAPSPQTIEVGETTTLTYQAKPGATVRWSTDQGNASIDSTTGFLTGLSAGPVILTAEDQTNGCQDTLLFQVTCPNQSLSPTLVTLETGQGVDLVLTGAKNNTSWSSSNPGVATVSGTGTVTGVSSGTATITARSPPGANCPLTANVTVVCPALAIEPASPALSVGETLGLSLTGGSGTAAWSSSNPAVATVDPSTGFVTAVGAGTATIRATSPDGSDCFADTTVSVDCPAPAVRIDWPDSTGSYGLLGSWGPLLPWMATPHDNLSATGLDQIDRVVFDISPRPLGFTPIVEQVWQYCGFGSDDCFANPGDVSGWPNGDYTLTATAHSTCGDRTATQSVTITVINVP